MEIVRLASLTEQNIDDLNVLLQQLSPGTKAVDMGTLNKILASDSLELWIAKESERIVGTATISFFEGLRGIVAHIDEVVVLEGSRGKGVGRKLMEKLIERARERQAREVELTSKPSRVVANAMYPKLGFKIRETNVYNLKLRA